MLTAFRRFLRWFAVAVCVGLVLAVFFEFFIELAKERGWYDRPSAKLQAAADAMSGLLQYHAFWWAFGLACGFAAGMWIDVSLRRKADATSIGDASRTRDMQPSEARSGTSWLNRTAQSIPQQPAAKMSRSIIKGIVEFDYSSNNGRCRIGYDEYEFETAWSQASDEAIYVLNDPPSIRCVALAHEATSIADFSAASKFDMSSRARCPREGEWVVLLNRNGYYAVLQIVDIKDRTRTDDKDEVTFRYYIQTNRTDDFIT